MNRLRSKKVTIPVCLTLLTTLLTGCFGRFPATRFIYEVNDDVSDSFRSQFLGRFVETVVMWVFGILPVYGLAFLGDLIIFNLIEFWTGDPIEIGSVTTVDGTMVTLAPTEDENIALLTLEKDGVILSENQIIRLSDYYCEIRTSEGELAGTMERSENGELLLIDSKGNIQECISLEDMANFQTMPVDI